jgi:hypothetical protein
MNETPVRTGTLVEISLLLVAAFLVYLFYISPWYWQCRAQIDPATFSTSCAEIQNKSSPQKDPAPAGKTCDKLWPDFGACNNTYDSMSSFWGDDFVSRFFENSLALLARWLGPTIREVVIPRWNRGMEPETNRKVIFDAIAFIFAAIAAEVLKDFYNLLKRRDRPHAG